MLEKSIFLEIQNLEVFFFLIENFNSKELFSLAPMTAGGLFPACHWNNDRSLTVVLEKEFGI